MSINCSSEKNTTHEEVVEKVLSLLREINNSKQESKMDGEMDMKGKTPEGKVWKPETI